jgi:hypothetical protein
VEGKITLSAQWNFMGVKLRIFMGVTRQISFFTALSRHLQEDRMG